MFVSPLDIAAGAFFSGKKMRSWKFPTYYEFFSPFDIATGVVFSREKTVPGNFLHVISFFRRLALPQTHFFRQKMRSWKFPTYHKLFSPFDIAAGAFLSGKKCVPGFVEHSLFHVCAFPSILCYHNDADNSSPQSCPKPHTGTKYPARGTPLTLIKVIYARNMLGVNARRICQAYMLDISQAHMC